MNNYFESALRLHKHLEKKHWTGKALEGPDPGVRLNARVGRFIKSPLRFIPWGDKYYYLQCQGYWLPTNWMLYDATGEQHYADIGTKGSYTVLERQLPEGHWEYPFPGWKGRIATVEGCYAAIAMISTYRRNRDEKLLAGADKWFEFILRETGFQEEGDTLSVNYFANMDKLSTSFYQNVKRGRCPNNSTLFLKLAGELYDVTGDDKYLEHKDPLMRFLQNALTAEGRFPYIVPYKEFPGKEHYLCFQYNAYQLLDMATYYEWVKDERVPPMLSSIAKFLLKGIKPDGSSKYDTYNDTPIVTYYTGVLGAALVKATELGLGDYREHFIKIYNYLLKVQKRNGSFAFSHRNYGILSDSRSYPRPLSMILKHLVMCGLFESSRKEEVLVS